MGFFSGRVTFARFRVNGSAPGMFGTEHLERLEEYVIGKQRVANADGVEVGWSGGDHVLDTRFELEKNIVNDVLHFAIRIDSNKIPADLLRAYFQIELESASANNPSGRPSARQKREARQIARERLEDEAKDGKFLKRKVVPVVWDAQSNELLVSTTSVTVLDRLLPLFEQTFGQSLEILGAGRQAFLLAETRSQSRNVDDAEPTPFVPGVSPSEVAWLPDEGNRDFLGNEFLLWLWYMLDVETDSIRLADGSEATLMLTRTLMLECPRGMTGRETFTTDGPTRLPEARKAIQSGKLPRKVGMIVVRHDSQYEMTLTAENLAVGSAKLPAPEEGEPRARLEERVTQLRHLVETLDLLYDAFTERRTDDKWRDHLVKMQRWLKDERAAA